MVSTMTEMGAGTTRESASPGTPAVVNGSATAWSRYPILRVATLVTTGAFLVLAAWNLTVLVPHMISLKAAIGVDFNLYMSAADHWLAGGSFYLERQLNGPYEIQPGDILYPPTVLWLLVPFRFLPSILWWAIPTAVIAWATWRVRPHGGRGQFSPSSSGTRGRRSMYLYGNPGIWMIAALAAATRWRSASTLVLLKPSLGPLALFGARHRRWWIAIGALGLASLPFAGLWLDYVKAATSSDVGIAYSAQDLPPTLAPLIAWLARTRTDPRAPAAGKIVSGRAGEALARGATPRSERPPREVESHTLTPT